MKANKKFRGGDEAVSPVIAVILMVAITVVLAATVYVWVSGFGGDHNQPAKTISLASNGPIADGFKAYTVSAATPSLRWNEVRVTVDGNTLGFAPTNAPDGEVCVDDDENPETPDVCAPEPGASLPCGNVAEKATICKGSDRKAASSLVGAGDSLIVPAGAGQVLRILDIESNSVILTLTLG